jgi:transcriptional regulator with XRE-family HTH domain
VPADVSIQVAFGQALRARRHVAGLSQEDLADKAGLHRTYVGSVERGERNPSLINIRRLAEAVEVTASDLLADAEKLVG